MGKTEKSLSALKLDPVIGEFLRILKLKLGSRLKRTVLFGSHARGEAHPGSDYDVLIIVDDRDPDVEEAVVDVELEVLDRTDALVTGLVYSEEEWRRESEFPLGRNILREGVGV